MVGDKLYLKTLTITKGNKKKIQNVDKLVVNKEKNKSSFYWLLKKEWLIIKRTPIFMLNIVVIVFLMPVIMISSLFITSMQGEGNVGFNFIDSNNISKYLTNPFIYLIVLVVLLFFTCSSMSASTSISREGSSAWFMKIIPVSYFKQVNVKVLFAVLLDMLSVVIVGVIPIIMYKIPI